MNVVKDKLMGALIGLICGFFVWIAIALGFYLLQEMLSTGSTDAGYRFPIILAIAPLLGAYVGFLSGRDAVLFVKSLFGQKGSPEYESELRRVNLYLTKNTPAMWAMVLDSVGRFHKSQTSHYGDAYFLSLFSKTNSKDKRRNFECAMSALAEKSDVHTICGLRMLILASKAVDDQNYEKLAKHLWSSAIKRTQRSDAFDSLAMFPNHLK